MSFKGIGKPMLKHEKETHGLVVKTDGDDDMYAYQRSFLEYGLLVRNFRDSVKVRFF